MPRDKVLPPARSWYLLSHYESFPLELGLLCHRHKGSLQCDMALDSLYAVRQRETAAAIKPFRKTKAQWIIGRRRPVHDRRRRADRYSMAPTPRWARSSSLSPALLLERWCSRCLSWKHGCFDSRFSTAGMSRGESDSLALAWAISPSQRNRWVRHPDEKLHSKRGMRGTHSTVRSE